MMSVANLPVFPLNLTSFLRCLAGNFTGGRRVLSSFHAMLASFFAVQELGYLTICAPRVAKHAAYPCCFDWVNYDHSVFLAFLPPQVVSWDAILHIYNQSSAEGYYGFQSGSNCCQYQICQYGRIWQCGHCQQFHTLLEGTLALMSTRAASGALQTAWEWWLVHGFA